MIATMLVNTMRIAGDCNRKLPDQLVDRIGVGIVRDLIDKVPGLRNVVGIFAETLAAFGVVPPLVRKRFIVRREPSRDAAVAGKKATIVCSERKYLGEEPRRHRVLRIAAGHAMGYGSVARHFEQILHAGDVIQASEFQCFVRTMSFIASEERKPVCKCVAIERQPLLQ